MAPIKTFAGKFAKAAFTIASPRTAHTNHPSETLNPGDVSTFCLEKMCTLFNIEPMNNLYLSTQVGERGVCLKNPVKQGDTILSIPISSCFRDDESPSWYEQRAAEELMAESGEGIEDNNERYNPSAWATRLAASVLDMELHNQEDSSKGDDNPSNNDLKRGREIWQAMLPEKDILRASLPVHWSEDVLSTSKCTALELAVDSAYFARANAVLDLSEEFKQALDDPDGWSMMTDRDASDVVLLDMDTLQRKCHDALDIVQTRACRVERKCEDGVQWGPPLRILAPVFDFINHGSSSTTGEGSANACFGVENSGIASMHDSKLVVRATRDVAEGEEVLIDYGNSARPAWRGLTSYGFVPQYDEFSCVAEIFLNGQRFEVDSQSVPFDLVEIAAAQALLDHSFDEEDIEDVHSGESSGIPPFVARAIAKRATEAAYNIVTEPEKHSEEEWEAPEFVHATNLAVKLRWSQHKVLLAFAENIKEFAEV